MWNNSTFRTPVPHFFHMPRIFGTLYFRLKYSALQIVCPHGIGLELQKNRNGKETDRRTEKMKFNH